MLDSDCNPRFNQGCCKYSAPAANNKMDANKKASLGGMPSVKCLCRGSEDNLLRLVTIADDIHLAGIETAQFIAAVNDLLCTYQLAEEVVDFHLTYAI